MARKLIDQEEAAGILGVSVDELIVMREQQKVYGYRDGGTWKYKEDELERAKREMEDDAAGGSSLEMTDLGVTDEPLEISDDVDSILLSESELGRSASDTSATVIGGKSKNTAKSAEESDLRLAGDSDLELAKPESDIKLSGEASGLKLAGDDLDMDLDLSQSGLSLGGSDVAKGPSDTGKLSGSDALSLEDDDLSLADSAIGSKGGAESGLRLADDEEEVVLGGGPDSDITLTGASDSGISLIDPADSGLSLEEEPVELGSSALGGSNVGMMELGEDDVISLEEETDTEAATQLKADDDFLLTPLDDAGVDESDSGSQVIALDTDEEFAGAAAGGMGMFGEQGGMLEEDAGPAVGVRAVPAGAAMAYPAVPEAPYSMWNVVALVCCALFLALGGMMMYDLIMHMWAWEQPYAVNSTIMEGLIKLFEK